ncbi:MAG: NAD(P)/FAD-dependent oxidoreductase [Alistipes sp.]|nr:NAD(P)/FAD-dependent oxidoreductase [Alistipes sp.]
MYDVIIIGAGAAGLIAAGRAAGMGYKTLVVEKMEKAARKVRITGKGRCNVTNTRPREEFLSHIRAGAEFFAPSFDRFSNRDTVRFFRDEGIKLEIERGERVFPASGKAWDIADALYDYARDAGAQFMFHTRVVGIKTIAGKVNGVEIVTRNGFPRKTECRNVIIATGGASYPSTGSTGDGYALTHSLGHSIEDIRPSLVPLEAGGQIADDLRGLRLKNTGVKLYVDGNVVEEHFGEMEFGSRGLEGAVILRLSRTAVDALIEEKKVEIGLDLKPALDTETIVSRIGREVDAAPQLTLAELIRKLLPGPMVAAFCAGAGLEPGRGAGSLTAEEKAGIAASLKDFRIDVADYRPFEEAVVTAGGVSTGEVDPNTLESKLVKGLYFAGEVLDIDADTGGYNLQIAFSTGYVAGGLGK